MHSVSHIWPHLHIAHKDITANTKGNQSAALMIAGTTLLPTFSKILIQFSVYFYILRHKLQYKLPSIIFTTTKTPTVLNYRLFKKAEEQDTSDSGNYSLHNETDYTTLLMA